MPLLPGTIDQDECPQSLQGLLELFAQQLSVPAAINLPVEYAASAPSLAANKLWYNTSNNTLNAVVNGAWAQVGANYKVGDIIMFFGDVAGQADIAYTADPARRPWAYCDGGTYNGILVPDLNNRFPKCTALGHGSKFGDDFPKIALDQIPPHTHDVPQGTSDTSSPDKYLIPAKGYPTTSVATSSTGGTGNPAPDDVRPLHINPVHTYVGFKMYIGY